MLFETYDPTVVWTHFTILGLVSMGGLIVFDRITRLGLSFEPYVLMVVVFGVTFYTYGWGWAALFTGLIVFHVVIQKVKPQWVPQGADPLVEPSRKDLCLLWPTSTSMERRKSLSEMQCTARMAHPCGSTSPNPTAWSLWPISTTIQRASSSQ